MTRLPRIVDLEAASNGWGFFLCARKEVRSGRSGDYLALRLQDASGEIDARISDGFAALKDEFSAGDFVRVTAKGNASRQPLELVIEAIRRVVPERDALDGFREDECILSAPRPADEMWSELVARIRGVRDPHLQELLTRITATHENRLKVWPAARQVHHAYRSGLLEHVLQVVAVTSFLADRYGARRDLLVAGAILHDIGKIRELDYHGAAEYSVEGNLVGHMAIGLGLLRETIRELPDFPPGLAFELEHLILSHHGSRELGSPVEPMTIEAFILAAADDLDAKVHQIRRHIADDDSDGPFTTFHRRLARVFLKPSQS
jgi:3'-5' exoribonuclease